MTKDEASRLDSITNAIAAQFKKISDALAELRPLTPEEQSAVNSNFARLENLGRDPQNPLPTA